MKISDESSDLNSNEQKQRNKSQCIWCEDSDKYISNKRQWDFQGEIHTSRYTFSCQFSNNTFRADMNEEIIQMFDKLLELTPPNMRDSVLNCLQTQSWFAIHDCMRHIRDSWLYET